MRSSADPCPSRVSPQLSDALIGLLLPCGAGNFGDPEALVSRLHRVAVSGGPGWGLACLLRRGGDLPFGTAGPQLIHGVLLAFGTNPNHHCLDDSTPMHVAAFSGRSLVMQHLLQAGGDLSLRDRQGCMLRDWTEQGGAKQSREVLELLQLCHTHIAALVHGGEWAPTEPLGKLQASSGHKLHGPLSSLWMVQSNRALRREQIRRSPLIPSLGFGQLSSLWPLGLVTGIPLADPKELLLAQDESDHTYESSSHTLMANLLWGGHPVTVRQLKAPGTPPDVLLADLQHCSSSVDLLGLCLLFEPVWLGSLHAVLHPQGWSEGGPQAVLGLLPGCLLLQVLEALLFLQARWRAHGGLSSHAVQLVRPGLAKVGSLEHGHPLHQHWPWHRPQQGCPWGGLGPGLPPPPELYPWLPLELICGDMLTTISDLHSFCILAQESFTGELPWAGREGPEVKAKLEAGESPVLDPLVPTPYQALVRAGLGLGPTDRWGSLQSTRYLLQVATAQDSAHEVSSPVD